MILPREGRSGPENDHDASRKRPPRLRIRGFKLRISVPGRSALRLEPHVRHECRMDFYGFAHLESYDWNCFRHSVEVIVARESMEEVVRGEAAANPPLWEELRPFTTEEALPRFDADGGGLVVAKIGIDEYPASVASEMGSSWYLWLDAIDGDAARIGSLADQMEEQREENGSLSLIFGSLFHVRGLAVHPAFLGQRIGLRMLAHTLWALHRSEGDVAAMLVLPIPNPFAPNTDPPSTSADAIRRLVRHYRRLGFRRTDGGRIADSEAVPMYLRFGEESMPVLGLGELGDKR